jgi:maleate isomerase
MTARIGLIIPSSNRMVEQEMTRHVPSGVQMHIARLRMTGGYHVPLDQLLPFVEDATGTLVDAKCDAIAFHCTANSTSEGLDGEQRLLTAVARAGAPRATTTATAIKHAFDALGARRIVLITPYSAHTTEEETEFLQSAGYDVLHAVGFALKGSDAYCATPAQFWLERTLESARPEADAYLLSCANISAFGIIDELERRIDRPVITSNQAILWDLLCQLDWQDRRSCPGRLCRLSSPAAPVRQHQLGQSGVN